MTHFDSRPVLWANLSALMARKWGRENLRRMAREGGFGPATVTRIKNQQTSIGLDVLDRLAGIFEVKPNDLIDADYMSERSVMLRDGMTPLARDLALQLDSIKDAAQRERAYAMASQMILLAAASPAPPLAHGLQPNLLHSTYR